jgi:hypothetical protein
MSPVLLQYMAKVCAVEESLGPKEQLDLASETGEIVDLPSRPRDYARRFLEARGTYILVKSVTGAP